MQNPGRRANRVMPHSLEKVVDYILCEAEVLELLWLRAAEGSKSSQR